MSEEKLTYISDRYGNERFYTTYSEFIAMVADIWPNSAPPNLRWHTDGSWEWYTNECGEIVLTNNPEHLAIEIDDDELLAFLKGEKE